MSIQVNYLMKLNKLQALQQQVRYAEMDYQNYKRSVKVFQDYVDCLRGFNNPKGVINGFIRMAMYCERMDDRLMATDLYSEALFMEKSIGVEEIHINSLENKISSLHYY